MSAPVGQEKNPPSPYLQRSVCWGGEEKYQGNCLHGDKAAGEVRVIRRKEIRTEKRAGPVGSLQNPHLREQPSNCDHRRRER